MMMNTNILEYKGYHTKIEFDAESFTLRGKIEGINDFVDFECENMEKVKEEFHSAVDDYLEFCKEVGKKPEKEYKGSFNIRISPDLHKELAMFASKNNRSLNSVIEKAIKAYVEDNKMQTVALPESARALTKSFKMDYPYENESILDEKDIIPFAHMNHVYNEGVELL